jgi:NADH-quinone oxidoreductase subunit C
VTHDDVLAQLRARFGPDSFGTSEFRDNKRVIVPVERLYGVLELLKEQCGFDMLAEMTAVDYLRYPNARDRYGVVYCLLDTKTGTRLVVKTFVNDPDPAVPSAYPLWKSADWLEREVFDMYGIRFDGHPDLRRILMPEDFTSYPLRKDYPLRGKGERHNLPVLTRAES